MNTVNKVFLLLFVGLFVLGCEEDSQAKNDDIDNLIESEKFEIAKEKIQKRFETPRKTDEILSFNSPLQKRQLELSNDRNRIVWTEDKKVIFRDLANPTVKVREFPDYFDAISPSSNAEHIIVMFRGASSNGCKLIIVSPLAEKSEYISNASVDCKNRPSISSDGKFLYYFIDNNLYKESVTKNSDIKLIIKNEKFQSPYKKIENKAIIYPIRDTFFIFYGNAGSYNMYWFNPKKKLMTLFAKNILIPKVFFGGIDKAHVIGGTIGKFLLREIKINPKGKFLISDGFKINKRKLYSWQSLKVHEFISSGEKGIIVKWGVDLPVRALPLICERFWGVARDQILYESKTGELALSDGMYGDEDWKLLNIYKQLVKMEKEK
ncbi:MAG: hypothetical protein H7A23_06810 [Leptospiraceae bacterium]|nr:hypothetical protein [Leptospiraceae bacterium]MCP5494251.1 hypothetical protein [Leptospiraceae bacterium]